MFITLFTGWDSKKVYVIQLVGSSIYSCGKFVHAVGPRKYITTYRYSVIFRIFISFVILKVYLNKTPDCYFDL